MDCDALIKKRASDGSLIVVSCVMDMGVKHNTAHYCYHHVDLGSILKLAGLNEI